MARSLPARPRQGCVREKAFREAVGHAASRLSPCPREQHAFTPSKRWGARSSRHPTPGPVQRVEQVEHRVHGDRSVVPALPAWMVASVLTKRQRQWSVQKVSGSPRPHLHPRLVIIFNCRMPAAAARQRSASQGVVDPSSTKTSTRTALLQPGRAGTTYWRLRGRVISTGCRLSGRPRPAVRSLVRQGGGASLHRAHPFPEDVAGWMPSSRVCAARRSGSSALSAFPRCTSIRQAAFSMALGWRCPCRRCLGALPWMASNMPRGRRCWRCLPIPHCR